MIPVYTAAEARAADAHILEGLGLPGIALMEAASAGIAARILRDHVAAAAQGTVVLCGPGNNGGDGFGVARRLRAAGLPVSTWSPCGIGPGDAATMASVAARAGVPSHGSEHALDAAGLVVDALFGTGLSRPIAGAAAQALEAVVASGLPVVAVDLPSGLCSDTGRLWGPCPSAVATVTLGGLKRGLFTGHGPAKAGVVHTVDLGFVGPTGAALVEAGDVARTWPWRHPDAHKGTSGHLLVVAGSEAQAGAAILTVQGALAAGVGRITLAAPRGAGPRLGALPPEAMWWPSNDGPTWDGTLPDLSGFQAVVVGPGLGGGHPLSPPARARLDALLRQHEGPIVVDADALAAWGGQAAAGPRVLTPHPGEAARGLGVDTAAIQADRFSAVQALAPDDVAVLKGAHTLIAAPGEPIAINPTGAATLATGGTGDVLAGVVGALLARGLTAREAAIAGVWVHGHAGELLAQVRPEGWRASDVAAALPRAITGLAGASAWPLPGDPGGAA